MIPILETPEPADSSPSLDRRKNRQLGWQEARLCLARRPGSAAPRFGVGDGASWIVTQMELRFKITWLEQQKMRLRQNHSEAVLDELAPFLERDKPKQAEAPVQACYRYIDNRPGQFDYAGALADLPIGSGEIESAHRCVIRDRLKIAHCALECAVR